MIQPLCLLTSCAQYGAAFLHGDPDERHFTSRELCYAMADFVEAVWGCPELLHWQPPPDNALIDLCGTKGYPLATCGARPTHLMTTSTACCTADLSYHRGVHTTDTAPTCGVEKIYQVTYHDAFDLDSVTVGAIVHQGKSKAGHHQFFSCEVHCIHGVPRTIRRHHSRCQVADTFAAFPIAFNKHDDMMRFLHNTLVVWPAGVQLPKSGMYL